jgi:hypothetical protein
MMDKTKAEDLVKKLFKKRDQRDEKLEEVKKEKKKGKKKKVEVIQLNHVARGQIEAQISDLLKKLNKGVRERNEALKTGLDVLEMARCSVQTEGLEEVEQMLIEAAGRFRMEFSTDSNTMTNLASTISHVNKLEKG